MSDGTPPAVSAASPSRPFLATLPFGIVLQPGMFRFILAVAVVVSHLSRVDIGRLAVLLFFFLSGYWTSRIWQEKFAATRWARFYLSRYWRIAPLFLLVTVVAAWLRQTDLKVENFTLLGVGSSAHDPTGVSWSLDVELQFYLLVPIVAALTVKAPIRTLLGCIPLAVLGWWLDMRYEVTTVAKYMPAFLFGVLTYTKSWKPSARSAHISLFAFAAFTAVTATTPFLFSNDIDPFDQDIWALVWMLPLLPYVAYSLTLRSTKLDRHLGNLSYPLYLIHFPTIVLLGAILQPGLGMKVAAAGLSLILTVLVYVLVDRPVDALRVRATER